MEKDTFFYLVLIILVAFIAFQISSEKNLDNSIHVSGTSTAKISPDKATISMTYENIADTALKAQQENERVMSDAKDALLRYVAEKDIQTQSFNVYKYQVWEDDKYVDKGYKATHTLSVSTTNTDLVGTLINSAINAGINNIGNIEYSLSDEKMTAEKNKEYTKAMLDAKTKASNIASASGSSLGKVLSVSESASYTPYYRYDVMAASSMEKAEPYSPKEVSLTVNLDVKYALG